MPESKDNELSLDELKDVSGAGMGLDRLGSNKIKGDGGLGGLGCNAGERGGRLKKGQIKDGIADRYACNDNLPG